MLGWIFYFVLLIFVFLAGYSIGCFVTNIRWSREVYRFLRLHEGDVPCA